jgi:hypothetical protein
VHAVRLVAAGEAMLSPTVTRKLIEHFADASALARRATARAALSALSDREREVDLEVGHGHSNAEIAARLYMSEATVKPTSPGCSPSSAPATACRSRSSSTTPHSREPRSASAHPLPAVPSHRPGRVESAPTPAPTTIPAPASSRFDVMSRALSGNMAARPSATLVDVGGRSCQLLPAHHRSKGVDHREVGRPPTPGVDDSIAAHQAGGRIVPAEH